MAAAESRAMATRGEAIVREAGDGDAARIAELATQLGYASTGAEILSRLELIRSRADASVFIAEQQGDVCGWIMVMSTFSLTGPAGAEIAGLVVDEAVRGQGIGKRLAIAAADWARAQGRAELRVRSNTIRESAHRFYEREGFSRIKTQVLFGKPV